ncbi:MAG: serine/threonine protein kinase [Planctomycetaceae bacterium]|nr:serine/threonine protein kinase [Planctomycetaceae bacterium]
MSTAANLIELLKQSQLVEAERLAAAVAAFDPGTAKVKLGAEATASDMARHLIRQQVITTWQAEKLLSGKTKGFFLGKYKLLEPLGAGGMSFVYLAENQLLGQRRAIKVLPKSKVTDSSYLERFYREARAAAQLNHPNIVRTFDIDQQGDQHYMVMEYIEGEDLSSLVKRVGPLPIGDAVNYLRQTAAALQHAHRAGLIHRDVKPGNLLLNKQGQVKLLDLGLAKFTGQASDLTVVHNETLMGTADFLSPEQALNSHLVDLRADIYSLGGTFYFLVAGHPPFPDGTVAQRLVRHQAVDPPTLISLRPECPLFLSQMCEWMMRKKAEERCRDCGEIMDWLDRWQRDASIALPFPTRNHQSLPTADKSDEGSGSGIVIASGDGKAKKLGAPTTTKPPARRRSNASGYWLLFALLVFLTAAIVGLVWAFQSIQ